MILDLQNAWELENNDNVASNFGKFKVFQNHLNCGKIGVNTISGNYLKFVPT